MSEPVNLAHTTVVKGPDAFCVARRDGGLPLDGDHPLGLYHEDGRHLRGHELRLCGEPPRLLVADDAVGTVAVFELTNPPLALPGGATLEAHALRARLERRVVDGGMVERLCLHSFAADDVTLDVALDLDADFAPMLELRGLVAAVVREVSCEAAAGELTFAARGRDGVRRTTTICAPGATASARDRRLTRRVTLAAGAEETIEISYAVNARRPARPARDDDAARADAWLGARPRVRVDDVLVDRVLRRSLLDARMLGSRLDGLRYYAAGVPWYATLFGRDAIVAALQLLPFEPQVAEETLRLLARRIGSRLDDEHDEEPGKILHELRGGEIAALGIAPLTRYYGSVDSTPLFLCLLCEHAHWTGSLALFEELRPQVEAALRWIDEHGDLDGDGLLEYRCRSAAGLVNQGWKDSWDGIVDERGVPLRAPIAVVEVQGYVVRAKRGLARLYAHAGEPDRAAQVAAQAAATAAAIEQRFWLDDRGYYALALDAGKRPSPVLASNQGHLLWALAVAPQRAAAIRDALMSTDAHSGWGVRTLATGERAHNPIGYHTGTIWPHDNALLALGLRAYGHDEAALRIFDDLLDAASAFPGYRLPELFAGYPRRPYEAPVPYPVACSPQAWAAGALPSIFVAALGLVPDALHGTLRIRRPALPRDVTRLELERLRVGDASVDLTFQRVDSRAVAVTETRVDGQLDVVVELTAAGTALGARD